MSGLLEVFWIVFSPFTALLNATTNLLLRLFGIDPMRRRWKSARKRYGKWQMPEAKKV